MKSDNVGKKKEEIDQVRLIRPSIKNHDRTRSIKLQGEV